MSENKLEIGQIYYGVKRTGNGREEVWCGAGYTGEWINTNPYDGSIIKNINEAYKYANHMHAKYPDYTYIVQEYK